MRIAFLLPVFIASCAVAVAGDAPTDVAEKLFSAMRAHDASAAAALFLPGAQLSSMDATGKVSTMPIEKFTERVGTGKGDWLERIWNPNVLVNGSIAVVWAEYDFHLDGKFSHCGVDSFQMFKTDDGWKISAISDTRVTVGCKPSPLGPPASK